MRVHPTTARRGTSLLALLMAFAMVFSIAAASAMAAPEPESRPEVSGPVYIDPELRDEVRSVESSTEGRERMQALLVLNGSTDLSDVAGDARAVAERLRESTADNQEPLTAQLRATSGHGFEVINQFWIIDAVLVEFDPSVTALDALASLPGVQRVVRNYEFTTPAVEAETVELGADFEGDVTWGIDRIGADEAWGLGFDGEGVRVAVLDTGLNHTHPDLVGKLATDDPDDPTFPGGWMQFDPDGNLMSTEPVDSDNQVAHGTHVAGTVLGGDNHPNGAIGVAPAATLMSGLVLDGGSGTFTQVAAGMQWAIDPVDSDGQPAGEPADVVNMSLGAPGNYPEMIEPTINMRTAGVFPAFSSGNVTLDAACGRGFDVPNLGSGSPGNVFEAVAVGNTTRQDTVNDGSCGEWVDTEAHWGDDAPAHWPETYVVPDVSAPGTNVTSAGQGTGYNTISGTSMAAPHVAGAAAMLVQAGLGGDVDYMEAVLEDTSYWTDLYSEDRPDRRFGHGRIDIVEALTVSTVETGIAGTVTGPDGPVAGASVMIGDWTGTTDAEGTFTRRVDPGEYDVTVSAFGYTTVTETVVVADEDELTDVTITLALAEVGAISGTVTDAETGDAIEGAEVDLVGAPREATTEADGTYVMEEVPYGEHLVVARAAGYTSAEAVSVVVDDANVTANFTLAPLPPAIGLWGDNGGLAAFLESEERPTVEYSYGDDLESMPAIIINSPDASEEEFLAFLDETEEAGVGVLVLDQWGNGYGISELVSATGNPESRDDTDSEGATSFEILAEHEILGDLGPGDVVVHDNATSAWGDHAWFTDFTSDEYGEVTVLADIASGGVTRGQSIAVRESEETGLRHVLMSSHGTTSYITPADYTDESLEIFLNALDWASDSATGPEESELDFSAPDEVFVGETIVIEGSVTPGGDREVTLVEFAQPVQADGEPAPLEETGQDFRFEVMTSVPGERHFEIQVAETEEATGVVSERFTVDVVEPVFSDVPTDSPFYDHIEWLAENGITTGYPDGTFRPLAHISREAMAAFVYRYAGSPEVELPAEPPFTDIDESEGFYTEMVWVEQQEISTGFPDGTFRPRANISREAISAFLYRAAGEPEVELPARSPFIDVPPTEGFYTEIVWMYQQGISTGYETDEGLEFRPRDSLTREAMAAFMYRFDDAVGTDAVFHSE